MPKFSPKSFQQIFGSMAVKIASETPITDFSDGSVVTTLLEAAAQEDFQQYLQMLNVIRNYNLDTTEGSDLDARASEYGLTRRPATSHSGFVTIQDTSFTKIATKLYAGLPGPIAGSTVIYVDDASSFPTSGDVYIGRGTNNSEGPISYSSAPVDNGSYWIVTLDVALLNDHGTDETFILAQGGNRTIDAGTEVEIPETDVSSKQLFELNQSVQLLDGENSITSVLVTALTPGGFKVPANSIIAFTNSPFDGAKVTNPEPFVNGRALETDQQLRDRIRQTIQSLSRGTPQSIKTGIVGLIDQATNNSVVSANILPPVNLADGPTKVYIDNGRGLEPSLSPIGLESLIDEATGGERFFQLQNFPVVKSSLISQQLEPFALYGAETIIVRVGTNEETIAFASSDFETVGRAKATEVAQAINDKSTLIEARTVTDSEGKKVFIIPKSRVNEDMQIDPVSTAQTALNFSERAVETLKLYKNDKLLTKDGITASTLSLAQPFNLSGDSVTTTDSDIQVTANSKIVSKTTAGVNPFKQYVSPGDYVKFSTDADAFYTRVRTVVNDTKIILETDYPAFGGGLGNITIWTSPQLEVAANGDRDQTEIVSFGPNDFGTPAQALASEAFKRIQLELNLSQSELVVNNTKIKLISDLENSENSKIQVTGGGAALSLGFCSSSPLTGTITFVGGSLVVTGVGTNFLSELEADQWIKANADGIGAWTKIQTIESDTVLYLTEGYRGLNRTNAASSKINPGELVVGRNKDYTLNRSNGQIELVTPLVAGDSLTAGSVNTRAFVDSVAETFNFDTLGASSTLIVEIDGGLTGTVTTGDNSAPYDSFTDTSLIGYSTNFFDGFYLEWLTGNNAGLTSTIASYNKATGQVTLDSGMTSAIAIGDKFEICQILEFTHAADFVDPVNATADEVVTAINAQILGGKAEKTLLSKVRIRTASHGSDGSVCVKGGSAQAVLAYPTDRQENQLTNTAYIRSQNTDREGNASAIGYTLGPSQNLVVIFDNDSLNKTFSVNLQVTGTVTSAGIGSFSDSSIGSKYATGFFKDFWLYWTDGDNAGSLQVVTAYVGTTGTFSLSDVFPATLPNAIASGDKYALVPRTANNVVKLLSDYNTTTLSIVGNAEVVGITGDFIQVSTKSNGSTGKVFISGGTANKLGIAIQSVPAGDPTNDVTSNSKAGLAKGLLVKLSVEGTVTTGDISAPYDTFIDTNLISTSTDYFTGMNLTFLTGNNAGFSSTIATYDKTTGQVELTSGPANAIQLGDTFRISQQAYVVDVQGNTAPYTITLNDTSNNVMDLSEFTPQRSAAIRDVNGLNFDDTQVEGTDGYKYYTGLIQKTQWTIDGLDSDPEAYPGIGAVGTQFEVEAPVIVKLKFIVNVVTNQGVSLSSVTDAIKTVILEYVLSRGVGEDVVLSEIIAAAQSVPGVFDVKITNHTSNIVIADGEIAKLDAADLIVG